MLRNIMYLVTGSVLVCGCISVHSSKHVKEEPVVCLQSVGQDAKAPAQLLRHVVLLKFKDGTSAADVRRIENAFAALPGKIEAIYDFEWGTDVSVEELSQGFTHCFVVTFCSDAARAQYLPHPAHKEFGSLLGPHLEKVLVVDYWTK